MIEVVERTNTVEIPLEEIKRAMKNEVLLDIISRYIVSHDYLDKKELMQILGLDKGIECESLKARKK